MRATLLLALLGLNLLSHAALAEQASRHEQGRAIYNFRCYYCHGYSGDAKTLAATFLPTPPRNFQATPLADLPRERMLQSVTHGVPGTAMKGFGKVISAQEIEQVVDFVRREFMEQGKINTLYHTKANGWPNHERYRSAYPFAMGEIPLDRDWDRLSPEQQRGKRLFLRSCVSCHDRAKVEHEGPIWELRPLSYPRSGYDHKRPLDSVTSASIYAQHDIPPVLEQPTALEQQGETLFQENCAFCHGADGTGRNWIGSFLEPHPRDLTDARFMRAIDRSHLHKVIRDGLTGTSMPAWKHVLSAEQISAIIAYISKAFHPVAE